MRLFLIILTLFNIQLLNAVELPDTTVSRGDVIQYPILLDELPLIEINNVKMELLVDISLLDLRSISIGGQILNESEYDMLFVEDDLLVNRLVIDHNTTSINDTLAFLEFEVLATFKDSGNVELLSLKFDNDEQVDDPEIGTFYVDQPIRLNAATFLSDPYPNPHTGEFYYDLSVFEEVKFDVMFEDVIGRKRVELCDCISDPISIEIVGTEGVFKRREEVPAGSYKVIVRMNTNAVSAGLYRIFIKADSFVYSHLVMYNK